MTPTPLVDEGRPSWPTEPCPTWCAAKTTHRKDDLLDDRYHFSSWKRIVELPTLPPVTIGNPPTRHRRELIVYVEQHVSEDTPRVIITDAHTEDKERRLDVNEATGLAVALLRGVSIITGDFELVDKIKRAWTPND
ncbi:DUF6907 domain-containing protein [Kibdelosporangium lantanae]|uniref:DUF6907 domain-containing protein n=1 Tax=Kibdelosporangium lantanae TaxID=1497396 RepID=A0ABW3M1A7_9PSEU